MAKTAPKSVAEMLRQEIDRSGLTGYEVAARAGLSRSVVHRFHRDGGDLRLQTAERIAAVLGCTITITKRKRQRGPSSG